MRKKGIFFVQGLSLLLASSFAIAGTSMSPQVIYGEDNRRDVYDVQNSLHLQLAESTVGLVRTSNLTSNTNGRISLATSSYASSYRLCTDERFYNQRTGAFCSGSLIGPNLVLTAGHCIEDQNQCNQTSFVFGFEQRVEGVTHSEFEPNEVRQCSRVIRSYVNGNGADYAIVEINEPVTDRTPLELNRNNDLTVGTELVVIGHPAGLPKKIADGASVRNTTGRGYFVANLDTYGGNSGSAVFNNTTGLIEGILVRGETDYTWTGSCYRSNVCTDEGCSGESVTDITAVIPYLPE